MTKKQITCKQLETLFGEDKCEHCDYHNHNFDAVSNDAVLTFVCQLRHRDIIDEKTFKELYKEICNY